MNCIPEAGARERLELAGIPFKGVGSDSIHASGRGSGRSVRRSEKLRQIEKHGRAEEARDRQNPVNSRRSQPGREDLPTLRSEEERRLNECEQHPGDGARQADDEPSNAMLEGPGKGIHRVIRVARRSVERQEARPRLARRPLGRGEGCAHSLGVPTSLTISKRSPACARRNSWLPS